ncbi:hypothetical protein BH11MYX1_BH11MYX1_16660 [soil metagenome]
MKRSSAPTSIRRLRTLILVALVVGISIFTGVMFTLVTRLSERFGPEVQADLDWRAERGAQELARSADLGLAVSDKAMVEEAFGAFAKSSDVMAIVAVGAGDAVIARQGIFDDTALVLRTRAGSLVRSPGYVASWAPAMIEGQMVGKVAVVVSTARMSDARSMLYDVKRTALIAGVVGLVLGCIVILFFTRAVSNRDRQLKDHAANLERRVEKRTRELDERNRGMRLVLDNVAQGFITIDLHGRMAAERSAIVDTWFGQHPADCQFSDVVRPFGAEFSLWFDLGLESVRDGFLPCEMCIDQMPRRFVAAGRTFDVQYSPILVGPDVEGILLILSDVSSAIERERTQQEQREMVELFHRITSDRAGFEEFFAEASELVESLRSPGALVVEKRSIHTLKGNCGIYGLESYTQLCHLIETEISDVGLLGVSQRARLVDGWAELSDRLSRLVGERRHVVEVDPTELASVIAQAHDGIASRDLAAILASWQHELVGVRFARMARQATSMARRLGKAEITVAIDDHQIRLDSQRWGGLWSAMIHAVRNAVDHGIETASEREAAGKSAGALIRLQALRREGRLVFTVADDGRGVNWEALRDNARRNDLAAETQADLIAALFSDGLSTRDTASDVSGRGVGLAALHAVVLALGGAIELESAEGTGTTLALSFPEPDQLTGRAQPLRKLG